MVTAPLDLLTPRDKTLVLGLGRGGSNKEIAIDLGLTADTVKVEIWLLGIKLGMNRLELAVFGARLAEVLAS
jgi:DNA-binding NarL/FixJ family response regulator